MRLTVLMHNYVTNLLVSLVDPRPVGALELQGDVLLLGGDQLLVARLHELRRLLVLDGRQASAGKHSVKFQG